MLNGNGESYKTEHVVFFPEIRFYRSTDQLDVLKHGASIFTLEGFLKYHRKSCKVCPLSSL